jgi:hypothetical protein
MVRDGGMEGWRVGRLEGWRDGGVNGVMNGWVVEWVGGRVESEKEGKRQERVERGNQKIENPSSFRVKTFDHDVRQLFYEHENGSHTFFG